MNAYIIDGVYDLLKEKNPLKKVEIPVPAPSSDEVLIRISCCGICHTELDEIEGRTPPAVYPVIPGHQVVGEIVQKGNRVGSLTEGDRVGVAWIFESCGECKYCMAGFENLCPGFKATGRDANGGYAEYMVAGEQYVYPIPDNLSDTETAPLLCAGAIGYRSLRLTQLENGEGLGLTGFGASGHLVLKMAKHLYPDSDVFVFARSEEERSFALSLGAVWAGEVTDIPPERVQAIIDTTPVWNTVVSSLLHLLPGGRLVINAIRKESTDRDSLLKIRYEDHLWMEKEIKTVANIAPQDVKEFLKLAGDIPIKPQVEIYSFDRANKALLDLKHKNVRGAKVLMVR